MAVNTKYVPCNLNKWTSQLGYVMQLHLLAALRIPLSILRELSMQDVPWWRSYDTCCGLGNLGCMSTAPNPMQAGFCLYCIRRAAGVSLHTIIAGVQACFTKVS